MLNVGADSPIVPEVISKFGDSLYERFIADQSRDDARYDIENERWKYICEKLYQIMWIVDAGHTAAVNLWIPKKDRIPSFGTQINAYKVEEKPITEEEYNELSNQRMRNYKNGE
jgi:hypothetical protein